MAKDVKKGFLVQGGILALAGILVRVIGMLYRIPVVNIIGSDGNGIYSAAFNVYNIILVLSSYGLPMAVSKLVSARLAKKEYKAAWKLTITALKVSLVTGGLACLFLFFGSNWIENALYPGVTGMAIPLRVLAPTVFIVAVLGVFRGFAQGHGMMTPTAVSQIVEQIVNAGVSIGAGYLLMQAYANSGNAPAYGAAGSTLGTCLGAGAALLFFLFLFLKSRKKIMANVATDEHAAPDTESMVKLIILTMIPIILGQTFNNINNVIDDILFNNTAIATMSSEMVKKQMGNYATSYILLLSIPQGIASAMSASLLPSIVRSYTNHDYRSVRRKLRSTIRLNMLIAIPCFIGLTTLGKPVIQILFSKYNANEGDMMLKIGAAAVIFFTLQTVTTSALQGIDQLMLPVKHSVYALIVHVVLVVGLLRFTNLGIYSLVIGTMTFPLMVMILNLYQLRKRIHYRQEIVKTFIVPFICAGIMGVCITFAYNAMVSWTGIRIVALGVAMVVAFITYFVPLVVLKELKLY